eukprot:GHVS01070762.1.p2 GENE.GHVS01070762.1~~GHVS01070762.1.p2  ORF type:complete len:181 (-),score=13.64 GHVS01070762.1:90-632(-)
MLMLLLGTLLEVILLPCCRLDVIMSRPLLGSRLDVMLRLVSGAVAWAAVPTSEALGPATADTCWRPVEEEDREAWFDGGASLDRRDEQSLVFVNGPEFGEVSVDTNLTQPSAEPAHKVPSVRNLSEVIACLVSEIARTRSSWYRLLDSPSMRTTRPTESPTANRWSPGMTAKSMPRQPCQ